MTKDEFIREACIRGYRNDPESVLGALYDVSTELPADHPYRKLMDNIREGKSPEAGHADISCMDHPYLVTEEILNAADAGLAAMDDTPAVKNARQIIGVYNEPWMQERARTELKELPEWRAYVKLDEDMLSEAGSIAADMKKGGNAEGKKDSSEFTAMTEAIEKFASSKTGAVYGSVLGIRLCENMNAMAAAIEKFIESEERNMKNPNVVRSLIPLRMADPEKAGIFEDMTKDKAARTRISLDELQGEIGRRQISTRNRPHTPEKQEPQYTRR